MISATITMIPNQYENGDDKTSRIVFGIEFGA